MLRRLACITAVTAGFVTGAVAGADFGSHFFHLQTDAYLMTAGVFGGIVNGGSVLLAGCLIRPPNDGGGGGNSRRTTTSTFSLNVQLTRTKTYQEIALIGALLPFVVPGIISIGPLNEVVFFIGFALWIGGVVLLGSEYVSRGRGTVVEVATPAQPLDR
jgi:hypothetical protein